MDGTDIAISDHNGIVNGIHSLIKINKTQIRKVGGNIFSLATKFLPKVMPAVSK